MSKEGLQNNTAYEIQQLVKKTRQAHFFSFFLIALPIALIIFFILHIIFLSTNLSTNLSTGISLVILTIATILFLRSKSYHQINAINILEHINRFNPEFEESAQLLLIDTGQLSLIQNLQFKKIKTLFDNATNEGRLLNCLPRVKFRLATMLALVALMMFFSSDRLDLWSRWLLISYQNKTGLISDVTIKPTEQSEPRLLASQVEIFSPKYTQRQDSVTKDLNLLVAENSQVHWIFEFSRNDVEYFVVGAESEKRQRIKPFNTGLEFEEDSKDRNNGYRYTFDKTITQTSLYRIVYKDKGKDKGLYYPLPGVYSITVILDKVPKIKLIEPNRSLVEVAKDGNTKFTIKALIKDDYGISEVGILASVAKGSGEAVKFRDKQFEFKSYKDTKSGRIYTKYWSLTELDMEPGDEVYFSVIAKDNKLPESQLTKSSTIIVRWLDEEEIEMAGEGIRIAFVAEYFRSQRQIIIETEQLIEDKNDLLAKQFNEVSTDLGGSQRDLKEKYGQYLGDEVGDGPSEQFGLADGYHGDEESFSGEAMAGMVGMHEADGESEHNDSKENKPEIGHLHEDMIDQSDLSGKSELIAQFAHNHGTAEIGPISKRDPKSWMKQAVNEMWQAELHLMLSEPEQALAYEYSAYKYLKLARQADRIYVKRLGFEPPPVSEENRLMGELNEILEYSLSVEDKPDLKSDVSLLKRIYVLLNGEKIDGNLTKNQKELLGELRENFLELANNRPAMIKYATTIEQILIVDKLELENCENCVVELKRKLWQLLPEALSLPKTRNHFPFLNKNSMQIYLDKIRKIKSEKNTAHLFKDVTND